MPSLYTGFKPIAFTLTPEKEVELMNMVARDLVDNLPEDILLAWPGFKAAGASTPSATNRLATFTANTVPEDFALIRRPDYLSLYQQGKLPAPLSPLWNRALGMPPVFKLLQADFNSVYNRLVGGET